MAFSTSPPVPTQEHDERGKGFLALAVLRKGLFVIHPTRHRLAWLALDLSPRLLNF
jgi:hypothetical protein